MERRSAEQKRELDERTLALCRRYQAGDAAAATEILRLHRRLVHLVFVRYRKAAGARGIGKDLVQEGRLGLLRAAHDYDPARGKWAGYAILWIRAKMRAYLFENIDDVQAPRWVYEKKARGRLGLKPTVFSMDSAVAGDCDLGERTWAEVIADEREDLDDYELEERADLCRYVAPLLLALLAPQVADTLISRARGEPLESIGARYGVSRQRIQQVEAGARQLATAALRAAAQSRVDISRARPGTETGRAAIAEHHRLGHVPTESFDHFLDWCFTAVDGRAPREEVPGPAPAPGPRKKARKVSLPRVIAGRRPRPRFQG